MTDDNPRPDDWKDNPHVAEALRQLREAVICMTTEDAERIADRMTAHGIAMTRAFLAHEIQENADRDRTIDWILRRAAERRAEEVISDCGAPTSWKGAS